MTDEIRHTGIFAAAGILVAVLIIAGIVAGGMHFPSLRLPSLVSDKGTLIVKLTDAPVELDQLNVTIDGVSVHNIEEDRWINLTFVDERESVTVDLLKLENVTTDLSIMPIPAGNYTMIELHIAKASALFHGETKPVELNVPSESIRIIIHFEIESDELRIVLIDMGVDKLAVSESGNLRPVVKAKVIP